MVAYHQFVELSSSGDSEARGQAAHLAAKAYLAQLGPIDEQAALYAALIGFLDDPSVKVRAALAYGLLHAPEAPRPILLALLHDSVVIARAVAQYSPALIEADLMDLVRHGEVSMLLAVTMRENLSARLGVAMLERDERVVTLRILERAGLELPGDALMRLAMGPGGQDPAIRGALFKRPELPSGARLVLVEAAAADLAGARIVKGAIAPTRLTRLMRDTADMAMTAIGEREAAKPEGDYAAKLVLGDRVSTRILLHAIVNGHVLFFADCVAELSAQTRGKVYTVLETGSRSALNALLARCGLKEGVRNLLARLVCHARAADLADDVAARHFVVTALTEELIIEHDGAIPPDLEEAFSYLSEQNVMLARAAARGVMSGFVEEAGAQLVMPETRQWSPLPAA